MGHAEMSTAFYSQYATKVARLSKSSAFSDASKKFLSYPTSMFTYWELF